MSTASLTRSTGAEILAVEDSPTQAEELKYILEKRGHAVKLARNGKQALAYLAGFRPALVISDINMPEMNGYQLCQQLKSHKGTQSIPVLLLTSLTEAEDVFQALACGADSYLTKPYHGEGLLDRVHQLLAPRARRAGRSAVEVEIALAGQQRLITVDPQQMASLLMSVFEAALRRNFELVQSQQDLLALNDHLEELVIERTAVLSAEIVGREELQVALHALSLNDELTGLHNRRGFMTLADQYWRVAARARQDFALLYIDLNDFKRINDRYGHAEGDLALQAIAQLLVKTFRDSDILARLGGDEFAVLLTDCGEAAMHAAAERLTTHLNHLNAEPACRYSLSLSLGLARFDPNDPVGPQSLLAQGDADMYTDKRRPSVRGEQ